MAIAALALATVLASCSPGTTISGQGSTAVSSTPPSSDAQSAAQLAPLMITRVPSGFIVQPDSVGDTGPSDFAKAVRDDGQADAAQALTADGFERGYQQLWINSSGAQLIDFVYQFRSAAGAQAYAQRNVRAAGRDEGKGVTVRPFTVRGVTHSLAVLLHAPARFAAIVLAETGSYLVQTEANATEAAGLEQRAIDALKEQEAKL